MNAARGGRHTGQDLHGIGGENTDEGLPVRAAGRGLLIYAGEPSPDWGNVVVLLLSLIHISRGFQGNVFRPWVSRDLSRGREA